MHPRALIMQNADGEGPGMLAGILAKKGWESRIIPLYLGEEIPSGWCRSDLLMVMGGPMNVYEEDTYPYLAPETAVIREAMNRDMPILGFCLGSQLMAKACGARVRKGHQKEIGWYPVRLTEKGKKDPLFKAFPPEFVVFQWHGDTFEIPEGANRLVQSDAYPNQAMRAGTMGYGFQFHLEVTKAMISEWLLTGEKEIMEMGDDGLAERVLLESEKYLPGIHQLAESFIASYLDRIVRR